MSYSCKECNLEFETEAGKKLHDSINHKQVPKKKKKAKEPLLTIKGEKGYLSPDGKHVIAYLSDGKSKKLSDLAKKMRTDFPDIELGDKLTPKEARNLFKHDIYAQAAIKGAKLKVVRLVKNDSGTRRYMIENSKVIIAWAEGPFPQTCATKSLRGRHYIYPTSIRKK